MKLPLTWLEEYLGENTPPLEEMEELLTQLGLEVEDIKDFYHLKKFVIGEIISVRKHENADRLKVCEVSVGGKTSLIICGAKNVRKGIKVVIAKIGTRMPNGLEINKTKIRGINSNGMICSSSELLLGRETENIMELPEETPLNKSAYDCIQGNPVISLSITPNRADCLSIKGIARDIAAKKNLSIAPLEKIFSNTIIEQEREIVVKTTDCPFFYSRVVIDVDNTKYPSWLEKKMFDLDLEPINTIVDIIRYVTFNLGQPVHAYDLEKLTGTLFIRKLDKGTFEDLNNKKISIEEDIVLCNENNEIFSLVGIIGGSSSACLKRTKKILLEAAVLERETISKTKQRLNLTTDSSIRSERGLDSALTPYCLDLVTKIIVENCGGKCSKLLKHEIKKENKKILFKPKSFHNLTGVDSTKEEMKDILNRLGFKIKEIKPEYWQIEVPSWRHDCKVNNDIIEEILRIKGYKNLSNKKYPNSWPLIQNKTIFSLIGKIKKCLAGMNLVETISFPFTSKEKIKEIELEDKNLIEITNPIQQNQNILRPSLLPKMIEVIKNNLRHDCKKNFGIFEVGYVYKKENEQKPIAAIMRHGLQEEEIFTANQRKIDMFSAKKDILTLLYDIRYIKKETELILERYTSFPYHPGQSGIFFYYQKGKRIPLACFGMLHPALYKKFEIYNPVSIGEVFIENLFKVTERKLEKEKKSFFPKVERDFSFFVKNKTKKSYIIEEIKKASDLIHEIEIIDIYDNFIKGKKQEDISLTIRIIVHPEKKTLDVKQIKEISNKVIRIIENKFNGIIR